MAFLMRNRLVVLMSALMTMLNQHIKRKKTDEHPDSWNMNKWRHGGHPLKPFPQFTHSQKQQIVWKQAELAVLRIYVENQAILEPILLYQASKCKQTKEQKSEDCLWTHFFYHFIRLLSAFLLFYVKMQTKQDQIVL